MTKPKELKVGMEVLVTWGSYKGEIAIVDEITPNGAIVVMDQISKVGRFVYLRKELRKMPTRKEG